MASKLTRCPTCGRRETRSTPQNAAYWALLHEMAEQLKPQGKVYTAEVWHEYFRQRFLGAEDVVLPNGKTVVRSMSTTELDIDEFSDYLTQVQVWAVEHGIIDASI